MKTAKLLSTNPVCFPFRTFKLELVPDYSVFSNDVIFESTNGPISFEPTIVYRGTLRGKFLADFYLIDRDNYRLLAKYFLLLITDHYIISF